MEMIGDDESMNEDCIRCENKYQYINNFMMQTEVSLSALRFDVDVKTQYVAHLGSMS